MEEKKVIISNFINSYKFLSNFYISDVYYDGILYSNSEAAFQSAKCINKKERLKFQFLNPRDAKRLGRNVSLRPDWNKVKDVIMYDVVFSKFSNDEKLKRLLINTDDAYLIEGNTWHDNYWGNCTCDKCKDIDGKNILGKTLMMVREDLKMGIITYCSLCNDAIFLGDSFYDLSTITKERVCMSCSNDWMNKHISYGKALPEPNIYSIRRIIGEIVKDKYFNNKKEIVPEFKIEVSNTNPDDVFISCFKKGRSCETKVCLSKIANKEDLISLIDELHTIVI